MKKVWTPVCQKKRPICPAVNVKGLRLQGLFSTIVRYIIFDEATSNIDVESENDIMNEIQNLAESKTVILISHRLVNVVKADAIYVMVNGKIAESGKT